MFCAVKPKNAHLITKIDGSNKTELWLESEVKPKNEEFEKSSDHNKLDFHTEQIDSNSINKNTDNFDRESEEWEEISNKVFYEKNLL